MGAMRQIKGVICILISIVMCWSASAANNKRYVNIVFIGNSITFGAGLPKPVHTLLQDFPRREHPRSKKERAKWA